MLTMWDWGGPATFAHDELTTDKRNPTANAYGPIYGVDWGNDGFLIVDPLEHTAQELRIPVLDPKVPPGKAQSMPVPSPYWGDKLYWYDPAITNHAAMDGKGRVWMSSRFRLPENQPAFCATHPSAALAPQTSSFRQVQYFDPKTRQFKQVNICFDTHHVQFAPTRTRRSTATASSAAPSAGSTRASSTRPATKRRRRAGAAAITTSIRTGRSIPPSIVRSPSSVIYSVIPHPSDGSVWGAAPGPMPGKIIRIDPKTCVGEAYEPPFDPAAGIVGYTPRGIDVDSNGVIWTALASSGHLASFDRRKCKGPLQGPSATDGQHCREGWTLHPVPGPRFKRRARRRGRRLPVLQLRRSLQHVRPRRRTCRSPTAPTPIRCSRCSRTGPGWCCACRIRSGSSRAAWTAASTIRRPAGRGAAIYADYGPNAVWHIEGGLGTRSAVVKFQLRPDPLAK